MHRHICWKQAFEKMASYGLGPEKWTGNSSVWFARKIMFKTEMKVIHATSKLQMELYHRRVGDLG